jgi:hypothetical protein
VEEADQQQVAVQVGRLHLTKTRLSGSARRKIKKARERQCGTGSPQQPGHVALPKPRDVQIRVPERPRSESGTPAKEGKPVKRPRDLTRRDFQGSLD